MWFHKEILEEGYCRIEKPKKEKRIGKNKKIRYFYRVRTFNFSTFNWIHDNFYKDSIKTIPLDLLNTYQNPQAQAIWIKDDGTRNNKSLRFCTHSFKKEEILKLGIFLKDRYNINTSIHRKSPLKEQYKQYIKKDSYEILKSIVLPYKHKSMLKKLP